MCPHCFTHGGKSKMMESESIIFVGPFSISDSRNSKSCHMHVYICSHYRKNKYRQRKTFISNCFPLVFGCEPWFEPGPLAPFKQFIQLYQVTFYNAFYLKEFTHKCKSPFTSFNFYFVLQLNPTRFTMNVIIHR